MTKNPYLNDAIGQLNPLRFSSVGDFRKVQHFQTNLDYFVYKLKLSGAKVVLNKNQHFLQPQLGSLAFKILNCQRKTFSKSLSLYRLRRYKSFSIYGNLAIAEHAAILIDKKSIIKLQLRNKCTKAIVLVHSQDLVSTFDHALQIIETNDSKSGYFICGSSPMPPLDVNQVRHIKNLTVQIY